METLHLDAKTALVTGAAGAIGKGIAAAFAREGLSVFITDLDQEALDEAAREVSSIGAPCECLAADVTDAAGVSEVVATATEALGGRIDVLVNVAGVVAQGYEQAVGPVGGPG